MKKRSVMRKRMCSKEREVSESCTCCERSIAPAHSAAWLAEACTALYGGPVRPVLLT